MTMLVGPVHLQASVALSVDRQDDFVEPDARRVWLVAVLDIQRGIVLSVCQIRQNESYDGACQDVLPVIYDMR
jgi:hypothetical protein